MPGRRSQRLQRLQTSRASWLGLAALLLSPATAIAQPGPPARPTTKVVVGPPRAASHGAEETPVPTEGDQNRERVMRMQEALREIVHGGTLRRLRVGMRVMDAGSGRLFFEKRGDALMDPASNQKVLATATALMRLGPEWRFHTELSGPAPDEDGVVAGDVFLRGSGDPTVRSGDLEAMATRLARRGVRRILGAAVADPRRLGADDAVAAEPGSPSHDGRDPLAAATPAGDSLQAKLSPRAPLLVNHGLVLVRVRPGPQAGAPALVSTSPADDSLIIRNSARTRDGGGRTRLSVRVMLAADGKMQVEVAGRVPAHSAGLVFRRRVPHQALYSAVLLRAALASAGITTRDRPRIGLQPAATPLLERHESAPLSLLLRRINKDSDNDHSERVLEAAGAEVYGGAATPDKGVRLLRDVISDLGLSPASYVSHNGSGLGHANRITANAMATLLRELYTDPRIGPEIMQSLSVGGIDGTTRNRFKGTLAARRVRAKTGTLNGKSCLSGFVGDGQDVVVFSILVEGLRGRSLPAVRGAQVGAVNAMMRYVRERSGERIDLPPGFDQPLGTPDFEVGEELSESEGEVTEPAHAATAGAPGLLVEPEPPPQP